MVLVYIIYICKTVFLFATGDTLLYTITPSPSVVKKNSLFLLIIKIVTPVTNKSYSGARGN
jgi:hypothetical protein